MSKPIEAKGNGRRVLIGICLFAFMLRICAMFATSSYRVIQDDTNHFGFGWEMGRVAASLAEGRGFSSPLPLPTGPTAIVGPVYPLILALVFKLFGVYTTGSAIAIRILQSVFASLTCIFIYLCGRDSVGDEAGKLAALAWALFPLNIFFTVDKVWETSLTAMLVAALFWYLLGVRGSLSVMRWMGAGVLIGVAALVNTSLVVLVLPFAISALWRNRMRVLVPAGVGALTCLAVVSPWMVRNHAQFGTFMLRSNFPLEFRIGNNEWSYGQKIEALHPSNNPELNRHWQDVGEPRFMAEDREANSRFVRQHGGRIAFSTVNRIVNYWTGAWIKPIEGYANEWPVVSLNSLLSLLGFLGVWRMWKSGNSDSLMFAGCFAIYPVVYYLTTSQPRFYHAMTPLIIVCGTFWMLECARKFAAIRAGKNRLSTASSADLESTL